MYCLILADDITGVSFVRSGDGPGGDGVGGDGVGGDGPGGDGVGVIDLDVIFISSPKIEILVILISVIYII
tara:strand:+ start:1646 stop:1858 length:213 start_codon:yes stop_codon:yes gene_type:complete